MNHPSSSVDGADNVNCFWSHNKLFFSFFPILVAWLHIWFSSLEWSAELCQKPRFTRWTCAKKDCRFRSFPSRERHTAKISFARDWWIVCRELLNVKVGWVSQNCFYPPTKKLIINLQGLYKGLYPSIVKSGLATGLHFFLYEELLSYFNHVNYNNATQ